MPVLTQSTLVRALFAATTCAGIAALLLAMARTPRATADRCQQVEGVLTGVQVTGGDDVVFQLADDTRPYFVERGTERGIDAEALHGAAIGQRARLFVRDDLAPAADQWPEAPLPGSLGRIEIADHVIFSEW